MTGTNLTVEQLQGLLQKVQVWTQQYKDGEAFYVGDQTLNDLSVLLQDSLRTKQQVNTLQEELNIAHYANESLSNQFHKIREHNHMQGQQIQSLQVQVNTLTEALQQIERFPFLESNDDIRCIKRIASGAIKESPREEQTP